MSNGGSESVPEVSNRCLVSGDFSVGGKPLSHDEDDHNHRHRRKSKRYLHVFIALMALPIAFLTFSYVHSPKKGFIYKAKEFSITLPKGWIEVPEKILQEYTREINELTSNAPDQRFDCAFQLDSAEKWFQYPYVMVAVKRTGKISYSELRKWGKLNSLNEPEKIERIYEGLISEVRFRKVFYDPAYNILWMKIQSSVEHGKFDYVQELMGMIPTEEGFIQIVGVSKQEEFPFYDSVFQGIVKSVKPADNLMYHQPSPFSEELASISSLFAG